MFKMFIINVHRFYFNMFFTKEGTLFIDSFRIKQWRKNMFYFQIENSIVSSDV